MTARTALALALAAAAGAWPFATGFGRVVLVLSERHKRGVHTGDLAAVPLALAAVALARRSRRGGDGPGGKAGAAASSSGPTDPRPTATPPPPHTLASTRGDGGPNKDIVMAAPNLPSDPTGADAVIAELAALVIDLNPPIVALAPHLARLSDPARTAVLDAVSAFRYQMHADDPGRAA